MNREILKKNFEAGGFIVTFFDTKEAAADYIVESISGSAGGSGSTGGSGSAGGSGSIGGSGTTVGFGGSMTAKEMGLYDRLKAAGNDCVWHWADADKGPAVFEKAFHAENYILSANGVSEEGYIVNIDGTGNRIAATVYGKKKVWFVVGKNKIVPTLEEAMKRADTTAAILNAKRFLPADAAEEQIEAKRDQSCRAMTIHRKPMNGMVCEIVFVDEELGY